MTRSFRLSKLWVVALLAILTLPSGAWAFSRDTHYYYTYAIALHACFDWSEAHIVASANRRVDGQKATKAEPNITKRFAKINWHAFGHSHERLRELWYRALDETDTKLQLVYFGQFLHFLQDWESHADFPTGIGHARASFVGKDPDSWARAEDRTMRMLLATGDHVTRFCTLIGRPVGGRDHPESALVELAREVAAEGVLEKVFETSSPTWKARRTGGFTKKGKRILEANADQLELFIERELKPLPEKNVPPDFEAYREGHGLPRPLDFRYDREGNLVGDLEELAEAGTRGDPADERGPDAVVTIRSAEMVPEGWKVRLQIENSGTVQTQPGKLEVAVVDPIAEEVLGTAGREISLVMPNHRERLELLVPVSSRSEVVMIEASMDIPEDMQQLDNEAWFMSHSDQAELEDALQLVWRSWRATEPFAAEDLRQADEPLAWLAEDNELCVVVWARLDSLDATDELEAPQCSLASLSGEILPLTSRPLIKRDVWAITVLGRDQMPAQKAWLCFDVTTDLCDAEGPKIAPAELRVGIGAGGVRIVEAVPLDETQRLWLGSLCGATGRP